MNSIPNIFEMRLKKLSTHIIKLKVDACLIHKCLLRYSYKVKINSVTWYKKLTMIRKCKFYCFLNCINFSISSLICWSNSCLSLVNSFLLILFEKSKLSSIWISSLASFSTFKIGTISCFKIFSESFFKL